MSKKQRGDTIIEVLLAMTVIGLVLGSSYAIANRSLRIGREAQERTEALKLVETQLERLRTVSGIRGNVLADPTAFSSTISAFCINDAIEVVQFNKPDFDSFTEIVRDEVQYPDLSGDRPCNQGTDGRYGIVITRSEEDQTYLYTIRARWEAIGGGPLQEINSQYRVYPIGNIAFQALVPPPPPDPTTLCQDPAATNIGDPLPCEFPFIPDPVVIPGASFATCVPVNPSFPCTTLGDSVYNRANYDVTYSVPELTSSSYNVLEISYSDFGSNNPPEESYNYLANIYINGELQFEEFEFSSVSGSILLPIDNPTSIDSIRIGWLNNYWVSTNTNQYAYDPDLQIDQLRISAVPEPSYTQERSVVSTASGATVSFATATARGVIENARGLEILERGIVYGPYENPSIENYTQTSSETVSPYRANIILLQPNKQYFYRAYVRTSLGYSYAANTLSFNTRALASSYTLIGERDNRSYYLTSGSRSFNSHNTTAQNLGGYLATLTNESENTFVTSRVEGLNPNNYQLDPYIGLSSDNGTEWRWITGETLTQTFWANRCESQNFVQPNNDGGNQTVVHINYRKNSACIGTWNDLSPDYQLRAVFEFGDYRN